MIYDFDIPVDRRGTDSQNGRNMRTGTFSRSGWPTWTSARRLRSSPHSTPAWSTGFFGYARPTLATTEAMVAAMQTRYRWTIEPSWLVWLPGLVVGLNVTVRAFARPGEAVLCNTPVYPPFMSAPSQQDRAVITVPLALRSGSALRVLPRSGRTLGN